eukprot:3408584-Amphidinium_carterae.1
MPGQACPSEEEEDLSWHHHPDQEDPSKLGHSMIVAIVCCHSLRLARTSARFWAKSAKGHSRLLISPL